MLPLMVAKRHAQNSMRSSSKAWLIIAAPALLAASVVSAAPWLAPGDIRARHSIQKLSDRDHYERGVTTWPMMWADVDSVSKAGVAADTDSLDAQSAYLRFEKTQQGSTGNRAELQVGAATEQAFVRGFKSEPREKGELSLTWQWQGESLAIGLSPSAVADPLDDDSVRWDGSYIAGVLGNWVLGAGAIERWWGPGWQSSLILSSNARPIPSVWVERKQNLAPESNYLAWLGPWQFTAFLGQLDDERAAPEAKMLAVRATFSPVQGLDIGLSRVVTFGGDGQSESVSTAWDVFSGKDYDENASQDSGVAADPSQQMTAIDFRYGFAVANQSMGLYLQLMSEDDDGFLPARQSWLLGADWTTQFFGHDQQWFIEVTNTLADNLTDQIKPSDADYRFQYQSGYQYNGRSTGSSFDADTDTETASLGLFNFFRDGSNVSLTLSYANFNKDGGSGLVDAVPPSDNIFYSIPDGDQTVTVAQLGYGTQLLAGWLDINLQATDKKIQLLSGEKDQWSASAAWTYRF